MSERINKTSICSVVFLDIIDYSKMSVSDQSDVKEQFNALINEAIKDVAQNDRIILDTGDGAAISLLGAPEEALFVSMTIREGILKHNKQSDQKLFVRIGINLGPVRVVTDINGQPNVIGDGINVAQRVMSFAEPNQILVSRSYYEVTSRLTKEITGMFTYSGVKHDKHVREHEVYAVRATTDEAPVKTDPPKYSQESAATEIPLASNKKIWAILAASLAGIVGIILFLSAEMHATAPESATLAMPQPAIAPPAASVPANPPSASKESASPAAKAVADGPKKKSSQRKELKPSENVQKNPDSNNVGSEVNNTDKTHSSPSAAEPADNQNQAKPAEKPAEKSGWDSFKQSVKQGGKKECTQGEIAMHQCK